MDGRLIYPNRKISETFLHFAEPLLHDLPSETPERGAQVALNLSFTVWNAVIFADVLHNRRHLDAIRRLTGESAESALLMEQLIATAGSRRSILLTARHLRKPLYGICGLT